MAPQLRVPALGKNLTVAVGIADGVASRQHAAAQIREISLQLSLQSCAAVIQRCEVAVNGLVGFFQDSLTHVFILMRQCVGSRARMVICGGVSGIRPGYRRGSDCPPGAALILVVAGKLPWHGSSCPRNVTTIVIS